jgi:hypothetical protein
MRSDREAQAVQHPRFVRLLVPLGRGGSGMSSQTWYELMGIIPPEPELPETPPHELQLDEGGAEGAVYTESFSDEPADSS